VSGAKKFATEAAWEVISKTMQIIDGRMRDVEADGPDADLPDERVYG
jgi:hypothetical protein